MWTSKIIFPAKIRCRRHQQNLHSNDSAHDWANALWINFPILSIDSTRSVWTVADRLAANEKSHDNYRVAQSIRTYSAIFQSVMNSSNTRIIYAHCSLISSMFCAILRRRHQNDPFDTHTHSARFTNYNEYVIHIFNVKQWLLSTSEWNIDVVAVLVRVGILCASNGNFADTEIPLRRHVLHFE